MSKFQQWVCWQVGGFPREKKGGDKGVDGWFNYLAAGGKIETGVISVKAGDNVNPNMVRDLGRVMERDKHRFGLFVMKGMPTKGMRDEAASQPIIETEFGRAVPGAETQIAAADQPGEKGVARRNPQIAPARRAGWPVRLTACPTSPHPATVPPIPLFPIVRPAPAAAPGAAQSFA